MNPKEADKAANFNYDTARKWKQAYKLQQKRQMVQDEYFYVPRTEVTDDLPLFLIKVQNCVDQQFMIRLILFVYTSTEFEKKFVAKVNTPYLLETQCDFWGHNHQTLLLLSLLKSISKIV